MIWVIQFLVRYRTFTSLFLTIVLSLWMISGSTPSQERIARLLSISVFYPFQLVVHQVTRAKNIYAENRRLMAQVADINTKLALLQDDVAENQRLQGLLQMKEDVHYDLLPARVVARDPSPLYRSVILNTGTGRGITRYMPVVNNQGVIGKTIQVLPGMCIVQLLRDPANRVSVMTQRGRITGILETQSGNTFFLRCRTHEDVTEGDIIVTSGLGGIYPRGLYVGDVASVSDQNDPLFKKAMIRTAVDFQNIEEVFVVRTSPQWSSMLQTIDSLGAAQ